MWYAWRNNEDVGTAFCLVHDENMVGNGHSQSSFDLVRDKPQVEIAHIHTPQFVPCSPGILVFCAYK